MDPRVSDQQDYIGHMIPFSEIYLLSDVNGIDLSVPADKKSPEKIKSEKLLRLRLALTRIR